MVKETIAQKHPYGEWLAKELFTLEEWDNAAKAQGLKPPGFSLHDTTRRLNLFGYTTVCLCTSRARTCAGILNF